MNTDRNRRLYNYHLRHPNVTLAGLARIFRIKYQGKIVSKQAIGKILKKERENVLHNV